jgi:hypothetical protein
MAYDAGLAERIRTVREERSLGARRTRRVEDSLEGDMSMRTAEVPTDVPTFVVTTRDGVRRGETLVV